MAEVVGTRRDDADALGGGHVDARPPVAELAVAPRLAVPRRKDERRPGLVALCEAPFCEVGGEAHADSGAISLRSGASAAPQVLPNLPEDGMSN